MRKLYCTTILAVLSLSVLGCDKKVAFQGVANNSGSSSSTDSSPGRVQPCLPEEAIINKNTNVIFVVDQSGSNVPNLINGAPGTDPDKGLRYGAMTELLEKHGGKNHIKWGLISFLGKEAYALSNFDDNYRRPKLVSAQQMGPVLDKFHAFFDGGETPYLPALEMAKSLIRADLEVSPDSHYRIAFITDGYPTDIADREKLSVALRQVISSTMSLSPNIELSTVYYGRPSKRAKARLRAMALLGKGSFVDATDSQDIHLGDVVRVPDHECRAR